MKLRLPEEMRDRIAEQAKQNGRSMNSEIVARLEASFSSAAPQGDVNVLAQLTSALAAANMGRLGAQADTASVISSLRILAQRVIELAGDSDPELAETAEVLLHNAEEVYRTPSEIQQQMNENVKALTMAMEYFGHLRGNDPLPPGVERLIDDAGHAMTPKSA